MRVRMRAVNSEHQGSTRHGDSIHELQDGSGEWFAVVQWDGPDRIAHFVPIKNLQVLRTDTTPFTWTNWSK